MVDYLIVCSIVQVMVTLVMFVLGGSSYSVYSQYKNESRDHYGKIELVRGVRFIKAGLALLFTFPLAGLILPLVLLGALVYATVLVVRGLREVFSIEY